MVPLYLLEVFDNRPATRLLRRMGSTRYRALQFWFNDPRRTTTTWLRLQGAPPAASPQVLGYADTTRAWSSESTVACRSPISRFA